MAQLSAAQQWPDHQLFPQPEIESVPPPVVKIQQQPFVILELLVPCEVRMCCRLVVRKAKHHHRCLYFWAHNYKLQQSFNFQSFGGHP